mgnify:FL=1
MHWIEELKRLRNSHHTPSSENENVLYIHIIDDFNYLKDIEKNEKNDQNRANHSGNIVIIDMTEGK